MSTRKEILVSIGIVAAAVIVIALYTLVGSKPERADETAEHDHAAMTAGAGEARPVRLDPESARRIGVSFATVDYGPLTSTVRVLGIVAYDETRLVDVSPKFEGWVEALHVDFNGAPVRRGQPLLDVYSPMLVSAQEELLLARRLVDETAAQGGRAAENARQLLESARRRLAYWDVPAELVAEIERSGAPRKALPLLAPAGGLVVEKSVVEGSRIAPGMTLYRIADLSRVWVEGEVFEKDLALVQAGRAARVAFDAYPGEVWEGRVTYVYPTLSAETRTGRIRVELPNPDLRLKPGMYANLSFDVPVHRDGLHVPRSAVLSTGTRSVVFVRTADGSLVPREITVGLAAGEHVEVLAGLEAGDVVVASANFLIDAESNLGAALDAMSGMEMGPSANGRPAGGRGAAPPAREPGAGPHDGHAPPGGGTMPGAPDTTGGHDEHSGYAPVTR